MHTYRIRFVQIAAVPIAFDLSLTLSLSGFFPFAQTFSLLSCIFRSNDGCICTNCRSIYMCIALCIFSMLHKPFLSLFSSRLALYILLIYRILAMGNKLKAPEKLQSGRVSISGGGRAATGMLLHFQMLGFFLCFVFTYTHTQSSYTAVLGQIGILSVCGSYVEKLQGTSKHNIFQLTSTHTWCVYSHFMLRAHFFSSHFSAHCMCVCVCVCL